MLEKILQANNWSYKNLWFKFESVISGEVEKIVNKIPQLKDYYYISKFRGSEKYAISNSDYQWEDGNTSERLPKAESNVINQAVKGIPRPFNTPFNMIIIDEINWFGISAKPMQPKDKSSMCSTNTDIDSSHIAILKEFNYGNKCNLVKIKIEVTGETNLEILDDSGIAAIFSEIFGNCIMSDMSCAFEEHEKEDYKIKETEASKLTDETQSKFWDQKNHMTVVDSGILPHHLVWSHLSDLKHTTGNAPKMSPKSAILKVFKSTDYRYVQCEQGSYYTIEKIDSFNNQILIGISMAPNCRRLEAYLEYKGLGFAYHMNLCQYTPDDQNGVEKFIENVYAAVKYLEQNYFPEIQKINGKTPTWLQYTKRN